MKISWWNHLVPIYKNKRDIQDCLSYHGTKFMSHAELLEKWLSKYKG